jgi:hypothetical protein
MNLADQMEALEARTEQEARENDAEASLARKLFFGVLRVIIVLVWLLVLNQLWN